MTPHLHGSIKLVGERDDGEGPKHHSLVDEESPG